MHIDVPVRRRINSNQWLLNVALPLTSSDNGFSGVIVVSLVPEYFSSFYDSLDLVEGSYVSLLLEDSTLLMSHPAKDESIGKVFGRNPALQPFLKQRLQQTSLRMHSQISQKDVGLNCRFAESHPIYLCISTPEEALLADWRKDVISIGSVALIISITILALFVLLSRQIRKQEATALQLVKTNKELDLVSKTDHLTGISNRQFIESKINELMSKAKRHNRPFSVILLDIDHFKTVNDTHGHAIGDQVLKRFSQILTSRIRATDMAGRWGGEEFLIACDESDLQTATQLAEILRQDIQNHDFGLQAPVTSSFGVTQFRAEDSFKTLLKRIDEHLYLAKDAGRNAVISR
ncbi:MAG: diguanylate cyclase [Motiliproteus sp.]